LPSEAFNAAAGRRDHRPRNRLVKGLAALQEKRVGAAWRAALVSLRCRPQAFIKGRWGGNQTTGARD